MTHGEGLTLASLVGDLKAYRGAWAEFCARLGVDPERTLFAYYTESRDVVESFDSIDGPVEVDAEHQAELLSELLDAWNLRISRSGGA